jgi:hypothetical protein
MTFPVETAIIVKTMVVRMTIKVMAETSIATEISKLMGRLSPIELRHFLLSQLVVKKTVRRALSRVQRLLLMV